MRAGRRTKTGVSPSVEIPATVGLHAAASGKITKCLPAQHFFEEND